MRISADRCDQGYHPDAAAFVVTLNGKPVLHAQTADEELGLVHVEQPCGCVQAMRGTVKIERLQ